MRSFSTTRSAGSPTSMRPSSRVAEQPGGSERRRTDRVLDRRAERVQVAHGLDHRQHAAGEHAVRAAHRAFVHLQVELAERRRPVVARCCGDRVGDEDGAFARRLPHRARGLGGEMDAVDDDRDVDVVACERRADDARVAMQQRAHRVEEVGDAAGAGVERGVRLRDGCVGVAERHDDAAREQHVDERARAGELRCERHQPHGAGVEQALEQRQVGVAARRRFVGAETVGREERAFEVHAEDPGPCGIVDRHFAHRREHLLLRARDQRWEIRRHAGLEQRVPSAAVRGGVCIEEVDAAEAVHLQVDEARYREPAAALAAEAEGRDAAVRDLDVARDEHSVDERCFDSQPSRHRTSLEAVPCIWSIPVRTTFPRDRLSPAELVYTIAPWRGSRSTG